LIETARQMETERVSTAGYDVRPGEVEGFETWTLRSPGSELEAAFAPKAGMVGCSLRHRGEELLYLGSGIRDYVRTGAVVGIPLLYPWANRLSGFDFTFADRTVALEHDADLIRLDPNGLPIHGLLGGSPHWKVCDARGDHQAAILSAELDFGAHEELLRAFPFPHVLRMVVTLGGAQLNIRTTVIPTGEVTVPISFGFHPYFTLPAPREEWEIDLPVQKRFLLDERMIPTGATEPVEYPRESLGDRSFDDGYADLVAGRPFVVSDVSRTITASFDDAYPCAQVYSPPGASFICFEPMTAPTNALRSGASLPSVAPGNTFSASFRIGIGTDR
jgi:aldose 1-epimerase